MATKRQVIQALEKVGCIDYDLAYEDSSLYSPTGFVWCASDCHALVISTWVPEDYRIEPKTKAHIYWGYVLEHINSGLTPCEDKDCETCTTAKAVEETVMNYAKALKEYDAIGSTCSDQRTTIADLVFGALHEMDMVEECQDVAQGISRKSYNQCKRFFTKWNKAEYNTGESKELPFTQYPLGTL